MLQWLLPDFPTENPLLNGMFCYICNGLVLVQRHWEQAAKRCIQCIFRTYADLILVGFSHHIYRKLLPKRKATNLKKMEKNCSENFERQFSDFSVLMTFWTDNLKLSTIKNRKNAWKTKFCRKLEYGNLKKSWKAKTERKLEFKNSWKAKFCRKLQPKTDFILNLSSWK